MSCDNELGNYEFTNNWFESTAINAWDELIPEINPTRILEVGSYEGRSACYIIDNVASRKDIELHCIDTWEGGLEHQADGSVAVNMHEVKKRFKYNIELAIQRSNHKVYLHVHQERSDVQLSNMISNDKMNYFDFIYIDGSHQAPDVLCDALLGFRLLKVGGVMVFDDYLWQELLPYGTDPVRCPKWAIDAFTNIYCRKIRVLRKPLNQLFVQKVCE